MKKINPNKLKQNIENIANYDISQNNISGCAYWVLQDKETVYKNCFGTFPCSAIPICDNTIFRLASMTKPITAVAALILVDRGLLKLSDPVTKYLPEFENIRITRLDEQGNLISLGKAKNPITVKHLLSHTSGIQGGCPKYTKMTAEDKLDVDSTVKFFALCGIDYEPESKTEYSAFGAFDVMVKIIELVSKQDFYDFIKKEIFLPCGMTDTVFAPTQEQLGRIVPMHKKENGQNAIEQMPGNCTFEDFPSSHRLGGAGLFSTLHDYSRFATMLLNGGAFNETQILSHKTLSLINKPANDFCIMSGYEKWGLSVRVVCGEEYEVLPVGSYGWSGAYGPHFWIDPENKIAAVFMKNSRFDGGAANASARAFEKAVHDSLE